MKYFIIVAVACFTSLFFIPSIHDITQSQSIDLVEERVIYQLPYPGLLPDSPIYFIKQIRDSILIFTTRDTGKKARLFLQISDKHMASALALAEKGRDTLAQEQLMKAEDQSLKIPPLLREIKEQGGSYPDDLVMDLYESNKKHREVITDVMKKTTETEIKIVETLLTKNEEVKKLLDKLQ
ncbi:hypothetical protein KBD81_06115 [Candidatus Woesebacteria bacterium]|nr:hypothetical protein [Candidatus Woesebacteria bacterium]